MGPKDINQATGTDERPVRERVSGRSMLTPVAHSSGGQHAQATRGFKQGVVLRCKDKVVEYMSIGVFCNTLSIVLHSRRR